MTMGPEFAEIVAIARARQIRNSQLIDNMIAVRDRYNAEWVMPVATDYDNDIAQTTALLIAEAIDFQANIAASATPMTRMAALTLRETGLGSQDWAHRRRRACGAVMHRSQGKLVLRRAYRHLAGYATCTLTVIPNFAKKKERQMPLIVCRDPLTTYPEEKAPEDLSPIENVAYITTKSAMWIRARYPEARAENGGPIAESDKETDSMGEWDMIEWNDEECTVVGVLGPHDWARTMSRSPYAAANNRASYMELRRWPNRAGMCTTFTANRVTLDKIATNIQHITGHTDLLARLTQLSVAATEKTIWPDRYVVGDGSGPPSLVDGKWKDGRTGEMNLVDHAKQIGVLHAAPDPNHNQILDRIERNARVSTGLVPQAGGETYGALRTGRGQDSMMSTAVDPRIRELLDVMGGGLAYLNEVILETFKGYWPERKYVLFSGWGGDYTQFEFVPSQHVETTENTVTFPFGGADEQGTTIILGQLNGMEAISIETLRERHPWIDDPAAEGVRVEREKLEKVLLESVGQQAMTNAIPPWYVAQVIKNLDGKRSVADAILLAQTQLQEHQAKMAPPPGPDQHAAPEQMPGLAPPGVAPVPPGPPGQPAPGEAGNSVGPTENQTGLMHLMRALKTSPPAQGPQVPSQVPAG